MWVTVLVYAFVYASYDVRLSTENFVILDWYNKLPRAQSRECFTTHARLEPPDSEATSDTARGVAAPANPND